jgi:hypothetical protein
MSKRKSLVCQEMQTYVFLDILCDYTGGVAIARATSKEDAIQRLLYEKSRYETIQELESRTWKDPNNSIILKEIDNEKNPLCIRGLPSSSSGTACLHDFETELRTTLKFYVISDNVPFAFFNGGGS